MQSNVNVKKRARVYENGGRKVSGGRSSPSIVNGYHEDTGNSKCVYSYFSSSGDYEDSGISDLEMNNFTNNTENEPGLSYARARDRFTRQNDGKNYQESEARRIPPFRRPKPTPRQNSDGVIAEPSPPIPPRPYRRPWSSDQSETIKNGFVSGFTPCPKPRPTSYTNDETVDRPRSPRQQVINNSGRNRRVSEIVEAIDRSRNSSPIQPRKFSELQPDSIVNDNWILRQRSNSFDGRNIPNPGPQSQRGSKILSTDSDNDSLSSTTNNVESFNRDRMPSPIPPRRSSEIQPPGIENDDWTPERPQRLDIPPPNANLRPKPRQRKMSRQENLDGIDLGAQEDFLALRNRQFNDKKSAFQTVQKEEQHLYEPLQLNRIPNNEEPKYPQHDPEYDELPGEIGMENWLKNQPENIPTEMEPETLMSPEDDQDLDKYRKTSTVNSFASKVSVASINYDLTVAPNEEDSEEEKQQDSCQNFYMVFTKWFATIFVAVIVLACVTLNKICLLVIGKEKSMPKDSSSVDKVGRKESIFIMLTIILMVPQALSFIAAIWSKRKSQPWPCRTSVLWIIFGGIIEAFCLSYLCIYAVTVLSKHPHIFLLFMSGLFLVPTVIQVYEWAQKRDTKNGKRRTALFLLAAIFQIGGLMILFFMEGLTELRDKIGIPLAIVLLSMAWSPKLRRLQTNSSKPRNSQPPESKRSTATAPFPSPRLSPRLSPGADSRYSTIDGMSTFEGSTKDDIYIEPAMQSAREKAALVMSFVKLIATPLAAIILCLIFQFAKLDDYKEGFGYITPDHPVFYYFLVQIFATLIGYHFAWLACSMYTQRPAFALPMTLATPLAIIFIEVKGLCNTSLAPITCGPQEGKDLYLLIGACALLLSGQFMSTGYYVWANKGYIMGKASHLFWLPSYTGALLEPFLLLNRRNKVTDYTHVTSKSLTRKTYVFICSTMYHEELYEMEQLLESLHDIDNNIQRGKRHVEAHIWFDGALKAEVMNEYVLQLATIVKKTLKVELSSARKIRTPYGMQLSWVLPGGLPITIHMKDNTKVKNKKRWSQVMYMSYVLDYKQRILQVNDDQTFILTTDADVNFTHDSMEALIDYMVRDDKIGAVCGRTHPMGNGPLVWYQTFDYAVGHWFAKVANHVFGSVLCCPGCFSLYRCRAVRSVLREYSSNVTEAFEFLTKDMGEDRWFCTLMVENGWRLAYCAAAEDRTYCPQEFEEFYKQRRRWMPSTLANLALLVSKWRMLLKNNENISFAFILFQIVLLVATLIGPSIVILFIVGGLLSLSDVATEEAIVIIFSILTMAYGAICLFFSQDIQIKIAKLLTFVFAIIMILVTIGLCTQIEKEVTERKGLNITDDTPLAERLPAGVSTLYLGALCAIFFGTALLHPKEFLSLIHGLWYLLCLPSGYLLLTIYSIVNMTDRSWGTREGKTSANTAAQSENPLVTLWKQFKTKCSCCFKCCQQTQDSTKSKPKEQSSSTRRPTSRSSKFRDRIRRTRSEKDRKGSTDTRKSRSRHGSRDFDTGSECSEAASSVFSTKDKKYAERAAKKKKRRTSTLTKLRMILAAKNMDSDSEASDSNETMTSSIPPNKRKGQKQSFGDGTLRRVMEIRKKLSGIQWNETGDIREGRKRESGGTVNPVQPTIAVTVADKGPIDYDEEEVPPSEVFGALGNRGFIPDDNVQNPPRRISRDPLPRAQQSDSLEGSTDSSSRMNNFPPSYYNSLVVPSARKISTPMSVYDDDASSVYKAASTYTTVEDLLSVDISLDTTIDEWLTGDLRPYVDNFKKHGYDTLAFVSGMSLQDLETIGVQVRGHRLKLNRAITRLPPLIIEEGIPSDVYLWLVDLRLGEYWPNFVDNTCTEPTDLEDLKTRSKDQLKTEYKVTKMAHLNMLHKAIQKLKYANQEQKQISVARRQLEMLPTETLEPINEYDEAKEYTFWDSLRQQCLLPESAIFTDNAELKTKLADLRNSVVMIFFVANALWMVVIMVLVKQTRLKTLGVDVLGLSFLIVYGTVTFCQFLAMIFHRLTTLLHILARTPWICCGKQNINYRDTITIATPES